MYWAVLVSYLKSTTKFSFELDYCTTFDEEVSYLNMVSGEQLSVDIRLAIVRLEISDNCLLQMNYFTLYESNC